MPEQGARERRAFLRRSFGEVASTALDAVARTAPLDARQRVAASLLAEIDHLVLLGFAGRDRREVFGALDGGPGVDFAGGTDEVMTAPSSEGAPGGRFTPDMLPVHTLLARSFARADHWRSDGRDPLRLLLRSVQRAGTPWAIVVDERQGISTTLLAEAGAAPPSPESLIPLGRLGSFAASGALPPVVLVEPRSLVDPADFASARELGGRRAADARLAEDLLHTVYDAVRHAERAGRRMLLLVAARPAVGAESPVMLIASGVRPGARITAPLAPAVPAQLHRARWGGARLALADEGVLALAEALGGPQRPLSRWPRTVPAYAPAAPPAPAGPRLRAALARVGLPAVDAESADQALGRLRAAVPEASLHSEQAEIRGSRGGWER